MMMRRIVLRLLLLAMMLSSALFLAACDSQEADTALVEDVVIELAVEPNPPAVGETMLMVTVKEAGGSPIDGATVTVHGDMDHEGMIPVDGESSDSTGGLYHVPFEWTMGGGWILDVTVTLPDKRGIAIQQFEEFVGAVSQDSVINRPGTDTAGMDHDAMANMNQPVQIHYMPDNDPALAGDATVTVIVTTNDGLPVDDATVSLTGNMMHEGMMPVHAEAGSAANGRYTIPLQWTMVGEWQVDIQVTLNDGSEYHQVFMQNVIMETADEDSD